MNVLAVVPARGGSKGVLRKNVRPLAGRPLISHTIEPALKSLYISDVVATSEDEEILNVAKLSGALTIKRPDELAQDDTKMPPVVDHVIEELGKRGKTYDILILLQPTCPFRTTEDIDSALEMLINGEAKSVMSVCEVGDHHPARMYQEGINGLVPFMPEWEKENRQNLPKLYRRNGLIYALRMDIFKKERTFFPADSHHICIPEERSVNIDEPFDFKLAELLVEHR